MLSLLGTLFVAQGCRSLEPVMPAAMIRPITVSTNEFTGSSSLLSGFDIDRAHASLKPGDSALVGVLAEIDGRRSVHYMLVARQETDSTSSGVQTWRRTIGGPNLPASYIGLRVPLVIDVYDEQGRRIERSEQSPPDLLLGDPLYRLAAWVTALGPEIATRAAEANEHDEIPLLQLPDDAALGIIAVEQFAQVIGDLTTMRRTLMPVISRPPLLSLLLGDRTVRIVITPGGFGPERRRFGEDELIVYGVPIEVRIGEHVALQARLLIAEPAGPNTLLGGITELHAQHPHRPEQRALIRLLAARRGPPPQEQVSTVPGKGEQ
ncbi:MAG: hypothetical protein JJU33_10040 [Phycisphaerales bacterium]|nr:hypothetical protein [Phycisphaerales bacterium]